MFWVIEWPYHLNRTKNETKWSGFLKASENWSGIQMASKKAAILEADYLNTALVFRHNLNDLNTALVFPHST